MSKNYVTSKHMKKTINNFILLKTIEDVDENDAIEIVSNPNLDGKELSEILDVHFSKKLKYKDGGKPLQLNNKVVVAGMLNRLQQLSNSQNEKTSDISE